MPTKDEMMVAQATATNKDEEKISKKSKLYNITKMVILGIAILVLIIGILGSMHWGVFSSFVMADFVTFLSTYNSIFIALIASIGAGGGIKNIAQAISKKKESAADDGESIVKGGTE